MDLDDKTMRSFSTSKVFGNSQEIINSLDFAPAGDYVVTGNSDDLIVLYDTINGKQSKISMTKLYGVGLIIFGHTNTTILHSSTKINDSIRYLSLHQNKYINYFIGHTNKVVTLVKSPVEDIIVSGSLDRSLMLWDLRSPKCQGHIDVEGIPVAAFDPSGLVLAVGINSTTIKMFDIRKLNSGSFITANYFSHEKYDWTDIKFSPNGKLILIPSNGPCIRLVNAFNGESINSFTGHQNKRDITVEASFSPDSKYIVSGSTDSRIHVWNIQSGSKVSALESYYTGPVHCVKFNPKYTMMASSFTNIEFWLPKHNFIRFPSIKF